MSLRGARRWAAAVGGGLACAWAAPAAEPAAWAVDPAVIRFDAQVMYQPSEPQAGVIARLPDGGLLPANPEPTVIAENGQALKSEIVWHNPADGLALVFEPPPKGAGVSIYVTGGRKPAVAFGPRSVFMPSLLLYTRAGNASLEAAQRLGRASPPGDDAAMGQVDRIGQRQNLFGPDDNYISYYIGWLKIPKTGKIFFCTVSDDGSELLLDGHAVASWPGLHTRQGGAKGEYGNWVNVTAGAHRIEYFHFKKQGDPEAQAAWIVPGVSPKSFPDTIPASAYMRSGAAELTRAAFRDGRPVAAFSMEPVSYLWLLNVPMNLIRIRASFTDSNPADTGYAWSIGDAAPAGKEYLWLIEDSTAYTLTLTATSKSGASKCSRPVVMGRFPPAASVNNVYDRKLYREALAEMCKAVPVKKDPCAQWTPDMWATLLGVVEPYRGGAVLLDIFARSRDDVRALKPADRAYLEDCFFEVCRVADQAGTLKWLDRLESEEKDRDRRFGWRLARIDFVLYDLGKLDEARKLVNQLRAGAGTTEEIAISEIRQGDIAREAGDIEAATKFYSAAQDKYREYARLKTMRVTMRTPGLARNKEELQKVRAKPTATPVAPPAAASSWKRFAVRESSYEIEIRNLIRSDHLVAARDLLRTWELELPLSKLAGDYPLGAAEFYMAIGRYARAAHELELYRKGVDISSSLPEALAMELDCLEKLNRGADALALAKEIKKRFATHPLSERAERIIESGISADKPKTEENW